MQYKCWETCKPHEFFHHASVTVQFNPGVSKGVSIGTRRTAALLASVVTANHCGDKVKGWVVNSVVPLFKKKSAQENSVSRRIDKSAISVARNAAQENPILYVHSPLCLRFYTYACSVRVSERFISSQVRVHFFTSVTGETLDPLSAFCRLHHLQCPGKERKTEFSQPPSNSRDQIEESVPAMSRLLVGLLCILAIQSYVESAGLVYDYYANSCPKAEEIIHDTVYKLYEKKGNIATSLIRFVFHDCFNGCDGSFLLESTQTMAAEKESSQQVGMRNQKYVNNIKAAVEAACPGVVSCADVLALGGAAGAQVLGGPAIKMKTGRRDSRVSVKAEADSGIPHPQSDVTTVLNYFSKLGISTQQTVALLGAHTIGRAHCVSFEERIYPTVDPKMDPVFANMLKYRCPQQKMGTTVESEPVHFTYFRNDEQSPMAFDNHYFVNLVASQGLLHIDAEMAWDARTKPYVEEYAKDNALWHKHFAEGFTILSEHNPLTGTDGEIRKHCSYAL